MRHKQQQPSPPPYSDEVFYPFDDLRDSNCSPPDGLTKPTPPRTPRDPTHQTLSHHAATYTRTLVGPLLQLRELTKLPACLPACNSSSSQSDRYLAMNWDCPSAGIMRLVR